MTKESDIRFQVYPAFAHYVIPSTFSFRVHIRGAKPNPVPAAQHSD